MNSKIKVSVLYPDFIRIISLRNTPINIPICCFSVEIDLENFIEMCPEAEKFVNMFRECGKQIKDMNFDYLYILTDTGNFWMNTKKQRID